MSDEFDLVRRLRPDPIEPADVGDPAVYTRAKEQFMSAIDQNRSALGIIEGGVNTPDVYPRLAYRDELAAIDQLVQVFQFVENREARMEFDGHHLAWLRMGTGIVMVGHANTDVHRIHSPLEAGLTTVMLHVYVHDVDAHYAHAVASGAKITMTIDDAFYGERRYEAADLEGHQWHFAERFESIRARGGREPQPGEMPAD